MVPKLCNINAQLNLGSAEVYIVRSANFKHQSSKN